MLRVKLARLVARHTELHKRDFVSLRYRCKERPFIGANGVRECIDSPARLRHRFHAKTSGAVLESKTRQDLRERSDPIQMFTKATHPQTTGTPNVSALRAHLDRFTKPWSYPGNSQRSRPRDLEV